MVLHAIGSAGGCCTRLLACSRHLSNETRLSLAPTPASKPILRKNPVSPVNTGLGPPPNPRSEDQPGPGY
jgi:hypothetical protein